MNTNRRKQINEVISDIEKMYERLQVICENVDGIIADEEERLRNVPEELYRSKRYQTACEAFDSLASAYQKLQNTVEALQAAVVDLTETTGGQE